MGKLRKEWTDAKKKFEALKSPAFDPKKYLVKRDLGPLLDKVEDAEKAADAKEDAKNAKALYDAADAALVVAGLYEREIVFLVKEIGRTDKKMAAEIDKAGAVLGSIAMRLEGVRNEGKRMVAGSGQDKNAPVRKAVEKGIATARKGVKATAGDPDFGTWNKVLPPALAPLLKAMELSGPMARDHAAGLKKHMEKRDPKQAGADMGKTQVMKDLKDVVDRLKALEAKLDTYLPKK